MAMIRSSPFRPRLPSAPGATVIGIMGGSFDPPHAGHAHVIATARRAAGLDVVWVLVSPGNPLKTTQTPLITRLRAARSRLGGRRTLVSDIESTLGTRFTVDTLRRIRKLAPRARFVWIMGADNLAGFHRWKDWRSLARLAPILVVARPGAHPKAGLSRFARAFSAARLPQGSARLLAHRQPPCWVYVTAPLNPLASSQIRDQIVKVSLETRDS